MTLIPSGRGHEKLLLVWSLVIPVKRLSAAKTRLAPLPTARRAELALAFVHDCAAAALAAPEVGQVLVVTGDPVAAELLGGLGARIAAEPEPVDGVDRLNAAIAFGAARSLGERPELRVGALTGDLPSLRTEELAAVLGLGARDRRTQLRAGRRGQRHHAAARGRGRHAGSPLRP